MTHWTYQRERREGSHAGECFRQGGKSPVTFDASFAVRHVPVASELRGETAVNKMILVKYFTAWAVRFSLKGA